MTAEKPYLAILQVLEDSASQRIDNYLVARWKKVPKSLIYRLLRQGKIRLNGKRAKPESRVQGGDQIRYPASLMLPQPSKPALTSETVRPLKLEILYEDDRVVVINKPTGLSVHAGSGVPYGLVETLRVTWNCPDLELVHRLDKPTSGCLLFAKRMSAHRVLQQAWKDNQVEKRYWVLVHGRWPQSLKHIRVPLSGFRDEAGERMIKPDPAEGKKASTRFSILKCFAHYTWLEALLETGRTHQIRAHARYAGFPIVGDDRYGDRTKDKQLSAVSLRLCLHARGLSFPHPVTAEPVVLEAQADRVWEQIIQSLGPSI